jgi:hypothetical protein
MPTITSQSASLRSRSTLWRGPYVLKNWAYFWILLASVAWVTPPWVGLILCGGVALHGVRGSRASVEALGILAFLLIFGKTDTAVGRWVILAAVSGRMLWDGVLGGESVPGLAYPILLFFVVILVLSVPYGQFPVVSGLKLTSFTLGTLAIFTSLYRTRHLRDYWLSWLFTLGVLILIASVPFYGLGAGYARNGVSFQGILTHPQTFGPVVATITALLTGLYFFRERTSKLILLCVGLGWLGVYFSLSRTSLFAVVLAGVAVVVFGFFLRAESWSVDLTRALSRPVFLGGMLLILGTSAVQWRAVQSKLDAFVSKTGTSASLVQALEQSRGALMSRSMENFWEKPLVGIGFGAPSNRDQFSVVVERGPYGIPLSASVEKGFMPTAVLEETGVVGALLTLFLLVVLITPVIQHPDPTLAWVMGTCLLVNLGEMVFFSVGGMGLYLWFVMGFCHVAALDTPVQEKSPSPALTSTG